MEDNKNEQNSTEAEESNMDICPCCGKRSIPKPAKINADLMDQWLACMVTATPFSHEYPLYDGRIKITVTRLADGDRDKVQRVVTILNTLKGKEWGDNGKPCDIPELVALLQVLASIEQVKVFSGGQTNLYNPKKAVLDACDNIIAFEDKIATFDCVDVWKGTVSTCYNKLQNPTVVSGVPLVMLSAAARAHAELYNLLLSNGFDKDFWQGIELV